MRLLKVYSNSYEGFETQETGPAFDFARQIAEYLPLGRFVEFLAIAPCDGAVKTELDGMDEATGFVAGIFELDESLNDVDDAARRRAKELLRAWAMGYFQRPATQHS